MKDWTLELGEDLLMVVKYNDYGFRNFYFYSKNGEYAPEPAGLSINTQYKGNVEVVCISFQDKTFINTFETY